MKRSLRSLTILYTVALACGVSFAVGVAMYVISSKNLQRAYERRYQAAAREAAYQLVDPVYQLDAYAVQRLLDLLAESDPSLTGSLVVDSEGLAFGGWSGWPRKEIEPQLAAVRDSGSWLFDTCRDSWRIVGPVVDASGQIHGAVAFEYSTEELSSDLNQTAGAALATALAVTLFGCLVGFLLARRVTRPFRRLVESVQAIGEQRFQTPVRVAAFSELRDLAEAIDRMAGQLDKTTVTLEEAESARREAERANRLKNRFLANLSHEIRTPLHAVVGNAGLLLAEGIDPVQAERVDGIQVAAGALLRLVEDILDLSTIESGNLELVHEDLDLVRLVHEVIEITQVRSEPGTLDLFGLVAPGAFRYCRGDQDRIRQVLVNLVSNALKFTSRGEVVLEAAPAEGHRVRFVVRDTGRGIPASEIDTVLQPFTRLVDINASVSGSGLGLAICQQLAWVMNGELRLESEEGRGTTVTFEVPLAGSRDAEPPAAVSSKVVRFFGFPPSVEEFLVASLGRQGAKADYAVVYLEGCDDPGAVAAAVRDVETVLVFSPSGGELEGVETVRKHLVPVTTYAIEQAVASFESGPLPLPPQQTFPGLQVLIVEDNRVNQLVLTSMLELLGCEVFTADDGREGIEAWRQHQPALIFMDCSMPVLDGFEATRQIRLAEARNGHGEIPILALTAYTRREDRIRSREVGMNAFLTKPLTLEQLQEALSTWAPESY